MGYDEAGRLKSADERRGAGPVESLCEAAPGLFALPDLDDAKTLVGTAGGVQDQPVGQGVLDVRCEPLVALPARSDVLDECVRHDRTMDTSGLASV